MVLSLSLFLTTLSFAAVSERPLDIHPMQREEMLKYFADPPAVFCSAPLWVWNDRMTEAEVTSALKDLSSQGVKQAFIHPRPGLMTPYLSDEWMHMYDVALKEAQKLGMLLWIYDENSYPSGFAGGFVPEQMPESIGKGLEMKQVQTIDPQALPERLVAVLEMTKDNQGNTKAALITDKVKKAQEKLSGDFMVFTMNLADKSPWHGGWFYVDLLKPGVTELFLKITLDPYVKLFGKQMGTMLLGSFTDEPNIRPAGGAPWTDDLDQRFQKRWGYSLLENLPSLFMPVGDWKRVRHNYYQLLSEEYMNHWGKPYSEYCEKNNLAFTGHYWDHEWPNCLGVPDNMAMYQWHQVPAIDCLMNQYREDTHAQFGNVRMPKELASVANQLGRNRRLCETYGAGGWDLRFEDMKRIGDWLYVLGVNLMDEHLSYITLRGARKRDHPQSFSYHEPWWEAYHVSANYFARLSVALSSGNQINPILVIEPTTSAWMFNTPDEKDPNLKILGERFQNLLIKLEEEQIEYDLGCEDVMLRHGKVTASGLQVGECTYATVILPEDCENLNDSTVKLLADFKGTLIALKANIPAKVNGKDSDLSKSIKSKVVSQTELIPLLQKLHTEMPRFTVSEKGKLFHQRRICQDGELLFLVNTSLESSSQGKVALTAGGVEKWDLTSGKTSAYEFKADGGKVSFSYDLPPAGSLLLFLTKDKKTSAESKKPTVAVIKAQGDLSVHRVEPNVLPLDYCSVTAGGESLKNAHFFQAQTFIFKKNGLPNDPWDNTVQFKDQWITYKFPETSGFIATFNFTVKEKVPAKIWAVVERPDLYKITCNEKSMSAAPGEWYLDKAFGKIDIQSAVKVGENSLTLQASPMTIYHELETVYLLGDFSVQPEAAGFSILPDKPLTKGAWSQQGNPFYSAQVDYSRNFTVDKKAGKFFVSLKKWYGSVAKVVVNGKPVGFIASQPWELEVTDAIQTGSNTVEVWVYGTLKNLLGPHHNKPSLGTAWPGMFKNAPKSGPPEGAEYSVVGYGLFEDFSLENRN